MACNSRNKGAAGEREFSNWLKANFDAPARRSQQYCGTDNTSDVKWIDGIHVEVKRVQALNIDKAMAQAVSDSESKAIPMVAHRKDRKKWMITIRAEDLHGFSQLVSKLNRAAELTTTPKGELRS